MITNPKRAAQVTPPAAVRIISNLLSLHVLPTPSQTVRHLVELLQRKAVSGLGIFDLQIIATMQANGITAYIGSTLAVSRWPRV